MNHLAVLKANKEKAEKALTELYKLKTVKSGKYYYDSYCKEAVELLEYLTGKTTNSPWLEGISNGPKSA